MEALAQVKLALDHGLVNAHDYDRAKAAFLRAQQVPRDDAPRNALIRRNRNRPPSTLSACAGSGVFRSAARSRRG